MIGRFLRWLEIALFFRVGRLVVRAITLNKVDPARDGNAFPVVVFAGALSMLAVLGSAAVLLESPARSDPAHNIFGDRERFAAYVADTGVASMATAQAVVILEAAGFRCHELGGGNTACERDAHGGTCGERQFVDLTVPGPAGAWHAVGIRFGRTCFAEGRSKKQSD